MKTLSIQQPWAQLILTGKKTIELRSWNTRHRGAFLIQASGNVNKEGMIKHGFEPKSLPTRAIVGKVILKEVKEYKNDEEFVQDSKTGHLSTATSIGKWKYGFILENPEKFEKPIPRKGQLGFFDVEE